MLTLVTYSPAFGEPAASPFCVKAMILLEMSGQAWQPEFSGDPRKGPKGKLPVLRDGGRVIPDSDAIRDYLEQRFGVDFDAGLSGEQRAVSRAFIRMAEEHIYFLLVCNRWLNDENWADVRRTFFGQIPAIINGFVTGKIRRKVRRNMDGQGMGRFNAEEQLARLDHDLQAVSGQLGQGDFLFGDRPTAADASVVPMLRALASSVAKTPLSERVARDAGLVAYLERGVAAMYPA